MSSVWVVCCWPHIATESRLWSVVSERPNTAAATMNAAACQFCIDYKTSAVSIDLE